MRYIIGIQVLFFLIVMGFTNLIVSCSDVEITTEQTERVNEIEVLTVDGDTAIIRTAGGGQMTYIKIKQR